MYSSFYRLQNITKALICLPFLASPALSQDVGPYVSIFGGLNLANDSDIRVEVPSGTFFSSGTMYYLDGAIGGVAIGHRWANGTAVEGELAYSRNPFDYETLAAVPGTISLDGEFETITLMANLYHFYENDSAFTPYVGVGAGVAFMEVSSITAGATDRFNGSDIGFAYQAIAGVSYRVMERTDIAFEYRFSGTSTATVSDNLAGTGNVTTHFDRTNQSFMVKLTYSF